MSYKRPVLSIFADGVRFDSLQYMPFLQRLNQVPLKTVLGYSITCHPSMYTGLYPKKHGIAFHWVKSKRKNGPYSFLSYFPDIFPFSNPYLQAVISHFYSKLFLKKKASPFMGYGKMLNLPMKFWDKVDINERKYWDEDGYINEDVKTIFELLRDKGYSYHVSNMHKPNLGEIDAIKVEKPGNFDWIYYFIGETDHISHEYKQHSEEGISFLKRTDDFIESRYKEFEELYGKDGFDFFFWSDHGHIDITQQIDLYESFKSKKYDLKSVFHLVDSTTARFWPNSDEERKKILEVMSTIPEAHRVTAKDFEDLHLSGDSDLYGDLFYYLDGGAVFIYTIHGFGKKTQSMHGYHPDAKGNDGLFVSNKDIVTDKVHLPDVFSTTLASLGIQYDPKIDLDRRDVVAR